MSGLNERNRKNLNLNFRFNTQLKIALLSAFTLILLGGCATTSVYVTEFGPNLEPTNPEEIVVYKKGEIVEANYKLIGKVYTKMFRSGFQKFNDTHLLNELKPAAAKMGADAIIGFYSVQPNPDYRERFGSGLAVKLIADTEKDISNRASFIIAIPPILITGESEEEEKNTKRDEWARNAAQFLLEEKGYYVNMVDVNETADIEFLNSKTEVQLDSLFGENTGGIFIIELCASGGQNAGIAVSRRSSLKAILYSITERKIIWENSGEGSKTTFGLYGTILGGHEKESIKNALEAIVENLQAANKKEALTADYIAREETEKEVGSSNQREEVWDDF